MYTASSPIVSNYVSPAAPQGEHTTFSDNFRQLPIQRKLTVGETDDPLEEEADEMAGQVMRKPESPFLSSFLQKQEAGGTPSGRGAGGGTPASEAVSEGIRASQGMGSPLSGETKNFMESRFGADFSDVNIHTGREASQLSSELHAQAFTVGKDIYFNEGKYAPGSDEGRHLLAHELSHTIQQNGSKQRAVQRMIEVDKGVNLDTMGFAIEKRGPQFYSGPKVTKSSVYNEIFSSMLHSESRIFKLIGNTDAAANASLQKHMAARLGVIDFASKKQYTFGAGSAFKMNPEYWDVGKGEEGFELKPGKDRQKAIDDLNVHPKEYALACLAATRLTMVGGGKSPLTEDTTSNSDDWVPGDWGYIKNTKFPKGGTVGLEGENIIYVGKDKFWGHFGPGLEYKTLPEWVAEVEGWNHGAEVADHRRYPTAGIED